MTISIISGNPGAGKTFEAMREFLIPALEAGRTVVTNVPLVFDHDLIAPHADEEWVEASLWDPEVQSRDVVLGVKRRGRIVHFDWQHVYGPHSVRTARGVKDRDKGIKPGAWGVYGHQFPGALFVLDELWRFIPKGLRASDFPDDAGAFFAEHRHLVGTVRGQEVTTEILLITQKPNKDVAERVLDLCENWYSAQSLRRMGMSSTYKVRLWAGKRPTNKALVDGIGPDRNMTRRLDKRYFGSYTSSKGGQFGDETQVDESRTNVLGWRRIVLFAALVLVLGGGGVWTFLNAFSSLAGDADEGEVDEAGAAEAPAAADGSEVPAVVAVPVEVRPRNWIEDWPWGVEIIRGSDLFTRTAEVRRGGFVVDRRVLRICDSGGRCGKLEVGRVPGWVSIAPCIGKVGNRIVLCQALPTAAESSGGGESAESADEGPGLLEGLLGGNEA